MHEKQIRLKKLLLKNSWQFEFIKPFKRLFCAIRKKNTVFFIKCLDAGEGVSVANPDGKVVLSKCRSGDVVDANF
jgi:hypothetical protein